MAVVHIELAFFHIDGLAEPFHGPVLLAVGKHLKTQALEGRIELPRILAAYCRAGQGTGDGDEKLGDQRINVFFPEVRRRKVFLLEVTDEGIELHVVGRIKYGIRRNAETEAGINVGRKVQIAVAETFYCLIVLGRLRGVKETGIFLGDIQLVLQIYLHWCFQKKEKIVTAA